MEEINDKVNVNSDDILTNTQQRAIIGGGALINSSFNINQLVVTGTVILSAGEYGHDQWRAGAGGCTYTFATSLNLTTITISAGTLEQEIEGINLQSSDYILHWNGTAQGQIDSGGFAVSPVTETLVGGTNSIVEFGTGTLIIPKLEQGIVATNFIHDTFDNELRYCQRYYEKSYNQDITPGLPAGDGGVIEYETRNKTTRSGGFDYTVTKRINPTIILYSVSSGNAGVVDNSGEKAGDVLNPSTRGVKAITIASGTISALLQFQWTADARL
jgi:hypothetical protein